MANKKKSKHWTLLSLHC